MEFPSFNHHHHHQHHHRYVPPPPPHNFPEDRPNFYPPHIIPSVNLPPPPLSYPAVGHLPPPPPPPLRVPPPPPPSQSYTPDFTFLDASKPSFFNNRSLPRFSNPPYRFDYRTGSRSDPDRAPPELPHRNSIAPEDHHHCLLYSPNPQSENYYKPHSPERVIPSSRFINNINDGYGSRDVSNIVSHNMNINKSIGSNGRNLEDYVEKYDQMLLLFNDQTACRS